MSDNFLANLQGVNGRLNYNTDTGAINYQTPTFLPSMYAANNLGNYYPTATDADGNMIGNISFADYLNNQSKAGQGRASLTSMPYRKWPLTTPQKPPRRIRRRP